MPGVFCMPRKGGGRKGSPLYRPKPLNMWHMGWSNTHEGMKGCGTWGGATPKRVWHEGIKMVRKSVRKLSEKDSERPSDSPA